MAEDITKGELVRVIVAGLFHKQECEVLAVEHNTMHRRELSDTWYLLDTRDGWHSWSRPYWFKPIEIEPVEVEREAQG